MPVHKMKFVAVNNRAPRGPSVCAACSRSLERGYLHDLSTVTWWMLIFACLMPNPVGALI
jgi:hypothetical protein